MEAPSQTLATKIVARLIQEKLLAPEAAKKLEPLLAEGKLRAEDWRLPIELGVGKEEKT
ncbi:hypothetical protein [Thermomonas sp.]|uniref:hypothetical protein n=1 Tax=Thermomonas sp. TaxID=1971895 RepID=UPI0024898D58|nr:hypothetical protein [Thermomonas sp.]MDI1252410.1 hypothetical protein [Thermomonas sp.]